MTRRPKGGGAPALPDTRIPSDPSEPEASTPPAHKRQPLPGSSEPPSGLPAGAAGKLFPIVGIGASAGGLEALELLFGAMPPDTGMAFVVITHQHPGHASMLPELLGNRTTLPVEFASDGIKPRPNSIYVDPPGGYLILLNGRLHRLEVENREPPHLPIDYFFRSLALEQQERAICIILSGTGTDGTLGLKAIKAESGMAMVQEVRSAQYTGMPSSALATGLVDYVLPPEAMPAQLLAYGRGPFLVPRRTRLIPEVAAEPLENIFALLRARTGHDFSAYKSSTIRRRIERRMNVHEIQDANQYVRYLRENPHEIDILFKELLISVTCFFRDAESFEILGNSVLPHLLESRPDNTTLRVWVPGCATGEEAYSIAILLRETVEATKRSFDIQIFGTDLDPGGVETARVGHYPEGIAMDVSPDRLERYFTRDEGGYRIRKDIREMVIFAVQNVIKDPPFTKIDLLICRNLLIYLNGELQKKLLPLFHYALRPGGLLFLGPSESIGNRIELFETVDKKWKIFRRKDAVPGLPASLQLPTETLRRPPGEFIPSTPRPSREPTQISGLVEKLLLATYAPASVIVNERGDVAYIHGRTGAYLEPAAGHPRMNVLDMGREGLKLQLMTCLRQAAQRPDAVRHEQVRIDINGEYVTVDISARRLIEPETLRGLFLISFLPQAEPPTPPKRRRPTSTDGASQRVEALERELQCTKESLQTTIEELETSNEELRSTNEELQSTNEELQSSNEELETSKEEMQSLNEELTTVNAELHAKVDELSRANDDMQNLLNSTEIATIFLDRHLHINRFTEQARTLVNLIQTDVGRPLSDLVSTLNYDRLVPDCREVLRTLVFRQAEVQTKSGLWYLMRIMPYRTADNVIDGLVLTFVDINPVKHAELELAATRDRVDSDLEAMTFLQEIGTLFACGSALSVILNEVLEAALCMTRADMGNVQVLDNKSGNLRIVAQRGFSGEWMEFWESVSEGQGTCGSALEQARRVIVEDVAESPLFVGTPALDVQLKAGVRAIQSTPIISPSGVRLGMISTHFRQPHRLDGRTERLLDLLARLTAAILERSGVEMSGGQVG